MSIKLKSLVPGPKYSGVLLDEQSHKRLVDLYKKYIPDSWNIYAHHMTINPFGLVSDDLVGKTVNLTVTHFGKSDKAIAVKVDGFEGKTNNAFPHITIAVNLIGGGKPKDSNLITDWTEQTSKTQLTGTIQNI